ncbi:MAG: exodeoxyribonuclease V subunit gamma [Fulvimonas sp.]|nr:exodeoxyribonuclease V subunit gamma [Fulvimonas sp.]
MHALFSDDAEGGIHVIRASRLEALLDPLLTLLDEVAPADALAAQTVIAAHPGMRQWLLGALARRRGAGGIVANLDIVLPSDWLDALARTTLGAAAVALAPYRRERLRWRIHALLAETDDPHLRGYLAGDDAARRRYRLADHLARLYSQAMVYRPDWLAAWEAGRDAVPEPTFLAPLWRALRRTIEQPHRAQVLRTLLHTLAEAPPAPSREPLHVFGLSHLAPMELAVLAAVARHRPVMLYVPDPCREYWAGLRGTRAQWRERLARLAEGDTGEAFFVEDSAHPLLADWGRLGQHFMLALAALDDVRMDVRHWEDEDRAAPPPDSLLGQVQESIRRLDVAVLRPSREEAALHDRSLRVHVCHTRLRELEVLRDALLRELAERPELEPADIVVMAPDIGAYVPLLPAVFGAPGRTQGPLPYHLADVAVAQAHPLLEAFERLLGTPGARLTAPEVLDLLHTPPIARALELGEEDIERLGLWLAEARVAWGLDGAWRAGFDVPPIAEHTFAWGMDRLLAGFVMGDLQARLDLPGGALWPLAGVGGAQATVLGALDRLLCELAALHRDALTPRRASAWAVRLEQLLDALFRIDADDAAGTEALALLRRLIHATATECADAGLDPELDFAVVREVLRERLAAAPERQRFLLGGVTFCGMVPQRAIPFRVIAVLGLDEGAFPRGGASGLDLIARHPRLGDRDVRSDDRYLFLETLMAARDVLHLSYLGEDVRDGKPRNPAAPLGELLDLLDAQAGLADDGDTADDAPRPRPWCVRHPLQPFDARYFDGSDPRLFSFRGELAALHAATAARDEKPAGAGAAQTPDALTLRELVAWYRDPARQLLRDRLGVRLDALEEGRLAEAESLDARTDARDRIGCRLLLEALERGPEALQQIPDWLALTGLLPPGRPGLEAWENERAQVLAVFERARRLPLFVDGLPPRTPIAVDERLGALRLQGELGRVYEYAGSRWLLECFPGRKEDALDFGKRVPLFIEWALLRRATPPSMPVRVVLLTDDESPVWPQKLNGWDERYRAADATARAALHAELESRLAALVALWLRAGNELPAWYFPKTSWSVIEGRKKNGTPNIDACWIGHSHKHGERDYAPGYARLLAGEASFTPGDADYEALVEIAERLARLILLEDASHD